MKTEHVEYWDACGNEHSFEAPVFDGVPLDTRPRLMLGVYRNSVLLGLFNTRRQAQDYLDEHSSLRMVEDYGFRFRIAPLKVSMELRA